ncbi:hypothetical protein [Xanthomonas phage RTH11]|nr:hypothetical protein [Xanthomonas phage RTH11]
MFDYTKYCPVCDSLDTWVPFGPEDLTLTCGSFSETMKAVYGSICTNCGDRRLSDEDHERYAQMGDRVVLKWQASNAS